MSLFEPALLISLSPGEIQVAKPIRWRKWDHHLVVTSGDISLSAALDELRRILRELPRKHRRWRVVTSNSWSRYLVAPWSDVFLRPAMVEAYVRGIVAYSYGDRVAAWPYRLKFSGLGQPVLIVLLQPELLEGLNTLSEGEAARLESLIPLQLVALRAASFHQPAWVAVIEPQVVTVSICREGRCVDILAEPNRAGETSVTAMMERWQWQTGGEVGDKGFAVGPVDGGVTLPSLCQHLEGPLLRQLSTEMGWARKLAVRWA